MRERVSFAIIHCYVGDSVFKGVADVVTHNFSKWMGG